jgi:hypothetical protein
VKGGNVMNLSEKIINNVKILPESKQLQILDFVEYLKLKMEKEEQKEWKEFSLSSAMEGMEDEESPYSLNDIKGA